MRAALADLRCDAAAVPGSRLARLNGSNRGNARASGYERHRDDWYREPRSAIDGLLDAEQFTGPVWDPACGSGNIPLACRARGIEARGSDAVNRGFGESPIDFLLTFDRAENIVTNPPFGLAEEFVRHALHFAERKVAVLARLAFLEGQKRRVMFATTPLARVWVFSSRVSMPPGDSGAEGKGGAVAFAWFVWDHDHSGPPTIGWLP